MHKDTATTLVTKDLVLKVIKTVYDPEIPVNIYELGLIYNIIIQDSHVKVEMTLTAPNCPEAQSLPLEVKERVEQINGVESAEVEIVWEPRWNPDMMSEEAKLTIGYF